jgi:peptidoglycan/LPS O-acetylase OafA/YrhL
MSGLTERLVQLRQWNLLLSLGLLAALLPPNEFPFPLEHLAIYGFIWATLCAALGYAKARVTMPRFWLTRAQSRAYPFYIFHQTVIVVLGWWMLRLNLGPWTFLASLTLLSFLATVVLCESAAAMPWLRPCLGMGPRPVPKASSSQLPEGRREAILPSEAS